MCTTITVFDGSKTLHSKFDGDLSKWDTSSVTDISYMFYSAPAFNADISKWQTGAVTNMDESEYTNLCVVTFVECSKVLFLSLILFLLGVCSLSPPSVFRAVAFLCSFW